MPDRSSPRVALLGFSIECNKFAPPATKAHFLTRTYLEGDAIVAEARSPTPTMLPETPGFVAAMDASGPWAPIGIALAMTEPHGPVEHAFFAGLLDTIRRRLEAALPLDAVYICSHGAGLTTEEDDPDGALFEMVRRIVGSLVEVGRGRTMPDDPARFTAPSSGLFLDRVFYAGDRRELPPRIATPMA